MAQVVQLAESASDSTTQTLPQNVEAEAALLGALMIDNRLVEDVQLKLQPHHFFEPLHGRIVVPVQLPLPLDGKVDRPSLAYGVDDVKSGRRQIGGRATRRRRRR